MPFQTFVVGAVFGAVFLLLGFKISLDRKAPVVSRIVGVFLVLLGIACFRPGSQTAPVAIVITIPPPLRVA